VVDRAHRTEPWGAVDGSDSVASAHVHLRSVRLVELSLRLGLLRRGFARRGALQGPAVEHSLHRRLWAQRVLFGDRLLLRSAPVPRRPRPGAAPMDDAVCRHRMDRMRVFHAALIAERAGLDSHNGHRPGPRGGWLGRGVKEPRVWYVV